MAACLSWRGVAAAGSRRPLVEATVPGLSQALKRSISDRRVPCRWGRTCGGVSGGRRSPQAYERRTQIGNACRFRRISDDSCHASLKPADIAGFAHSPQTAGLASCPADDRAGWEQPEGGRFPRRRQCRLPISRNTVGMCDYRDTACALRTRPPERLTPDVQLHQFCATDARRRRGAIAFGLADTTPFLAPEQDNRVTPLYLQGFIGFGDTVLRR